MKRDATTFREMTASDVVQRAFLVLPQGMHLKSAADLLRLRRVAAAPVTDAYGQCVGVLSAIDILGRQLDSPRVGLDANGEKDCVWCDWQMMDAKSTGDEVARYMTRDPLLVTPQTRLEEISRHILSPEPRPIVVVDEERRPIGILSSRDILVALAANHMRVGASMPASNNGQVRVRRPAQTSTG